MPKDKTVTINGRVYDSVTGMPLEKEAPAKKDSQESTPKRSLSTVASSAVHSVTQRSQTLQRRSARKATVARKPKPGRHMDIARSNQISRFAPKREEEPTKAKREERKAAELPPKPHPMVSRALEKQDKKAVPSKPAQTSSKQTKEAQIAAALASDTTAPKKKASKPKRKKFSWKKLRPAIIITAVVLIVGAGLYATYISVPSLSVRYAAIRAGIKAKYPEYKPDGYSLQQPVTYSEGQVNLVFESNSGSGDYEITQTRSSWDSTAVLDNIVKKEAGENYITTQERGLTIYTYGKNTAWVNGGVLYQIENDTLLSSDQIRRIATSL